MIKLILLQTTHILQHLTTFYQNTHNILSKHTQIFSQSYDQSSSCKGGSGTWMQTSKCIHAGITRPSALHVEIQVI